LIFYNNNETSNASLYKITNIVTDVHIRVRGTRGKHLSELLVSVYFCLR